jgi:SAM-dependent methyltransferase
VEKNLRDWVFLSALLGGALAVGGIGATIRDSLRADERWVVGAAGASLLVFVAFVGFFRHDAANLLSDAAPEPAGGVSRTVRFPGTTLFLASFVALLLEIAFIRYAGSQIRIFSFYKNVPLVAAYLGLGLGCALGGGRPRHVLLLLLWLVPLGVALCEGALLVSGGLGALVATASTEQVLGNVVVREATRPQAVASQVVMAAFCVLTLFALSSVFVPIGRLLGDAFERLPRLVAYTINIVGSLVGSGAFLVLGYLWAPPWTWMLVGLLPLLWWVEDRRRLLAAGTLVAVVVLTLLPSVGETIWSPYQKLVGRPIALPVREGAPEAEGYLVDISDVFYQVALDLRPAAIERMGTNPYPHYDDALKGLPKPIGRVLVVGAGTGNDVAGALRAGAAAVDAVDIDPAIVAMGRRHHPERPYDDPRVRVVVDDARAAFRRLPAATYDAVLFGLLDSHTQLGISSVRLDNYVFTRESFAEARRLLRPGGSVVVTAATFRGWFRERFVELLSATCDGPVHTAGEGVWVTYTCQVGDSPTPPRREPIITVPTDDWPYLYLPERGVPAAYGFAVIALMLGSLLVVRSNGFAPGRLTGFHGHLFFLGAAFLLMEVYAINRLALLFGTTWIVSAVTIMVVLTLIVAANATVALAGGLPYTIAWAGLFVSLAVSFWLDPHDYLGRGVTVAVGCGVLVLLPVYFAGLLFARSFASADVAGPAIGVNLLGSVLGGWSEYASMAIGIRALVPLACAFYVGSLVCLARAGRPGGIAPPAS